MIRMAMASGLDFLDASESVENKLVSDKEIFKGKSLRLTIDKLHWD